MSGKSPAINVEGNEWEHNALNIICCRLHSHISKAMQRSNQHTTPEYRGKEECGKEP